MSDHIPYAMGVTYGSRIRISVLISFYTILLLQIQSLFQNMLWSPLLCHTSAENGMKVLTTYEVCVHTLIKMKLQFHPLNQDTCVHVGRMLLFYIINNLNRSCTFFEYLLMYIISDPQITGKWHKFH